MLNVLINAYAVSPNWGSEPGMGWNWIVNIARHCNVFVITEGEWKKEILEAVAKLPQKDNIHFYFNPLPDKVRKMCWNQGDWRFYWYYAKWQKRTLEIARQIIADNHIDVMHQLNMIGFREPGYLWKIKDIPLVWGPVGGVANIPTAYLKGAGWKMNLFCRLKNFISDMQFRFHPRVRAAVKRSAMIAAMKEVQAAIKRVYGKDIPVINETGTYPTDTRETNKPSSNPDTLNVLWVGKFDFRKRLDLALKTVAETKNPNIKLTVCGTDSEQQVDEYKNLASSLGIAEQVNWMGKVDHDRILGLMRASDLFLFTSISDATSTVVLEAVTAGLPILSFNTCGFGPLVKDFAGVAIELSTPDESVAEFAAKLNYFYKNRSSLEEIVNNSITKSYTLSWDYKGEKISRIYKTVVSDSGGVILWLPINYKCSFNILWVGKFDFRKQFSLALRSVSMMSDKKGVKLHVVAPLNDEQKKSLEKEVRDLNMTDHVKFYGRIPNADVHRLMKRSDVFLFTSLSEGTPHVILEAISNNLPIVCFDICGHGEVVDNSIGIKIPLSNPIVSASQFVEALDMLKSRPDIRKDLANNCHNKQLQCSWQKKATKIVEIYQKNIRK